MQWCCFVLPYRIVTAYCMRMHIVSPYVCTWRHPIPMHPNHSIPTIRPSHGSPCSRPLSARGRWDGSGQVGDDTPANTVTIGGKEGGGARPSQSYEWFAKPVPDLARPISPYLSLWVPPSLPHSLFLPLLLEPVYPCIPASLQVMLDMSACYCFLPLQLVAL